jgi:two-component system chemotaxis sensor kinase CheA
MTDATPEHIFREEVADLLVHLEEALLGLEDAPQDRDLLDTAFRALHTIKGSGAMFGFDAAADFTHYLENAFDNVRKGEIPLSPELVSIALKSKDHIRALIEAPADVDPAESQRLLAAIGAQVGQALAVAAPPAGEDVADGAHTWRIRFRLAADAMAMGANPLLLLDELRSLGHCTVTALTGGIPPLTEMEASGCYLAWDVVLTTEQPRTALDEVFMFVIDDMELDIHEVDASDARIGHILVERGAVQPEVAESAAARQERLGEMLVKDGSISPDQLRSALAEQKHLRNEAEAAKAPQAAASSSIRVSAERLDNLMDQVGELVIAQARLKQLAATADNPLVRAIAEEIERLSNGLRDTTMGIRMVPIGSLFGRFRRLVRDLSQELGKDIALSMSGEETELDKTVIERLADPLVHIIRNSLDHGIEDGATRRQAGKSPQGHLHLSAGHSGAQVLITIRDDGRGINRQRVRAKAEEQGLIAEGAAISDSELLQMIFHPGFSTAETVTNLSGRGVGMDVVRRTIDSLRGTIDVISEPGHGTTITLRLPLTLAIIDGLLVRVGDGCYVIPLGAVEECVELRPEDDRDRSGRNFLNIRGDLVPFLRLREIFASRRPADPYQKVVVVSTGEKRIGLVVDQVIGDHQTVIKSLSRLHSDAQNFSGATILGDGTVALILDVGNLVEAGQARGETGKAA